ncbi:hypothetical protein [Jeotgalibacillus marinus]|uniref:Uncharacterized protein n=1 Tax=Jeotgalibacillus marinus TaxID=86667 RepID=A0ABV3PZN6_9BACL
MINESEAKNEIHQGKFSDHLAEGIAQIKGVQYVKVIVHEKDIAAAVTHSKKNQSKKI